MEGYIFKSEEYGDDHYLTKNGLVWYDHTSIEKAWVHPKSMLEELRARLKKTREGEVEVRPDKVYPATYSKETGTVTTGEAFDF